MLQLRQYQRGLTRGAILFATFVSNISITQAQTETRSTLESNSGQSMVNTTQCPVIGNMPPVTSRHTAQGVYSNDDWWPHQLNLKILHQNSRLTNPMDADYDYAAEVAQLDFEELKRDVMKVMTTPQDWWPADYGHYGPLFIRMAWHSAGTYRVGDGRGGGADGTLRFAPLNSWPDNVNLDKARRLLWPIKKKYGRRLSWADLMAFAGNCALESMGVETYGFAFGRDDVWEPQEDVFWGPESEWLGDKRHSASRELDAPLAATQMGLIYVNPEGPNGKPDPQAAAHDIRVAFSRMGMSDEETVALIAGGHTFGKAHGAAATDNLGPEPEAAPIEEQGLGWKNNYGKGNAEDTITSGLEGAWTSTPTYWSSSYLDNLFGYSWKLVKSPAGAWQWTAIDDSAQGTVPDAHLPGKAHAPMMFTTDLALKEDPQFRLYAEEFHKDNAAFQLAFAKAWYKLLHRDMGPHARLIGPWVPEPQGWQDPVPPVDHELVDAEHVAQLKNRLLESGLSIGQLVSTAWASASTYRMSDYRGGANGARIRLAPQKDWAVNQPQQLAQVLSALESIQREFNRRQTDGMRVSLADLIVLGGCAAIEEAARRAGMVIEVPFTPGRTDATQEMTDVDSFAVLEPKADGFRNYFSHEIDRPGPELLVDRANLLGLTAPEMTALVGGLRVLNVTVGAPDMGVLTHRPEQLTNDFFANLLATNIEWSRSPVCEHFFEGRDRQTGQVVWTASSVDLVFGANSQLRAIAEVYGADDGNEKFVRDFVRAWQKVMEADRFDLHR